MRGTHRLDGGSEKLVLPASQLRTDGGEENDEEPDSTGESAENGTESEGDGTTVLYLDLEGLFLNLLGLEVDLSEVELDVSAVPNPGALLGNLLSAVAGLIDESPLARLKDRLFGFELPSVSDLVPSGDGSVLSEPFYRMINGLLDVLMEVLTEDESTGESES